jgi:hypothetical protein
LAREPLWGDASKQIKIKLAPKSQPIFFAFFCCQSELYQRAEKMIDFVS